MKGRISVELFLLGTWGWDKIIAELSVGKLF